MTAQHRPRRRGLGMFDIPPQDMARRLERDRATFRSKVLVDPTPWILAKLAARHEIEDGCGGEGPRGVAEILENGRARLYWWFARDAAHWEGRRMLGLLPPDGGRQDGAFREIELNICTDGRLALCWRAGMNDVESLVCDRSCLSFIDGGLANRPDGREFYVLGGRVHLWPHDGTRPEAVEIAMRINNRDHRAQCVAQGIQVPPRPKFEYDPATGHRVQTGFYDD